MMPTRSAPISACSSLRGGEPHGGKLFGCGGPESRITYVALLSHLESVTAQ
jgi:hypothetical protein